MAKAKEPTEKRIVAKKIVDFSPYDLEGDIDEVLQFLQKIKDENAGIYRECIKLEVDWYRDENPSIVVTGHRLETDLEFSERRKEYFEAIQRKKDRLAKEAARHKAKKAKSEAEERKLYEQLKRKFGS